MKRIFSCFLLFVVIGAYPSQGFCQNNWKANLLTYINAKLAKPDGGYGWEDQYDSHLTPTYAVTGILYDINSLPKDKEKLATFIKTHHPQKGKDKDLNYASGSAVVTEAGPSGSNLRSFVYQQLKAISWLDGKLDYFKDDVLSWKSQAGILANYEGHNYGGLEQEAMMPICSRMVGGEMLEKEKFIAYLESCRRPNGSFNNAPASAGGDGNILNTYWALLAQQSLNQPQKLKSETIAWLNACQMKNGGFTHQPNPQIGVNDDVAYTWAAIKSMQILDTKPQNTSAAIAYLVSLRNADGGFGDRPGLHSTPVASFYAIDALKALDALSALDKSLPAKPTPEPKPDFTGHQVYTVQFQAQGQGSPLEAVMLADSLNINLWGVKYPVDGWLETAQKIANQKKVPVTFFIANEPHDNEVIIPGMGSFNHVLDFIAPAKAEIHFKDSSTFDELKATTLKQLKAVNGGLMLQVSNNEPLARLLLDESVNNFGYLAISTVHFGQNFMFWLPYIAEYRYRLPLVTLQDAHGKESWWWADELTNHRTLFIAKEPTYDAMIQALKNNWIVGVRHDSLSNLKTRMLGGTQYARNFIQEQERSWKWWDNSGETSRPQAAISVLSKGDLYEEGKPESGLSVRVRTRWNSTRETLKSPAVSLSELTVDGKKVEPELKITKGRRDNPADAYYLYQWGNPAKGLHTIVATVKNLSSGKEYIYTQTFDQK